MVFSILLFLFRFLPVMLIVYFAAPKRFRNGVLFIGSLIFYGWGEPVYISLLLFSTLVDYVHGRLVWRFMEEGKQKRARLCVASSVIINLGLLGVFKYADFLLETVGRLTGLSFPLPGLALPIGISFYTFQTMSYTIDIYRKEASPQKNIIDFGAYVSMFPQLIAGPIVRYHTIAEELRERTENFAGFSRGVGYSDMAMGLGAMMGFHFPENFRYPYTAKSITDFWRRWHITLSTWFKEYVYIPLGGNRRGAAVQVRNIAIVWLLTGIWHGAAWNYLLWGLYFGVLLLLEKFILKPYLEKMPSAVRSAYAMIFVFLGWVLFAHENMAEGLQYFTQMAGAGGIAFASRRTWYLLVTNLPLLAAAVLGSTPLPGILCRKLSGRVRETAELLFVAVILVLSVAFLVDASYNPFLYFRF